MKVAALALAALACTSTNSGSTADAGGTTHVLVGTPCTTDSDCGTAPFFCHLGDHPGGYCMRYCDITHGDADCPNEAICQFDGTTGECHRKCDSQSDCRQGYVCAPASSDPGNKASHAYCDVPDMSMGDGGMDARDGMGMDGMPGMDM